MLGESSVGDAIKLNLEGSVIVGKKCSTCDCAAAGAYCSSCAADIN